MDNKIRQITREIQKGKFLEENIPQLFNHMANHYQLLSKVRLAMHYYTFYESFYDDENSWSEQALEYVDQVNVIIRNHMVESKSGEEREKAVAALDSIRKDVMKRMEVLTAYADMFQIYEYVLNRMEYRFKSEAEFVDDEEFAKEILRYIFDTEDNMIINEKIKDMIGQLPIRITKQKYFDIIKDSMSSYKGCEASTLESYLYMMKTSAMLYHNERLKSLYPTLWEKKELLNQVDYQNISRDLFDKAINTLHAATIILETETSVYFGLQEVMNDLYAFLLCEPYAGMVANDSKEEENAQIAAQDIVKEINDKFITKNKDDIFDEVMDQFSELEGVQEEFGVMVDTMESAFFEVSQNNKDLIEGLMLEVIMNILKRSQTLLSNSLFVDFDTVNDTTIVDENRITKEVQQLEGELTELFATQNRVITRAIMANTINKVPVFFKDHKEVMDYVRYSLDRCSDVHEKIACIEIIREIMSE